MKKIISIIITLVMLTTVFQFMPSVRTDSLPVTIPLPVSVYNEGFEDGLTGWTITSYGDPDQWLLVSSGSNPTCTPPEGSSMVEYNSYNVSFGNAGTIEQKELLVNFTNANKMTFQMFHNSSYVDGDYIAPTLSNNGVDFYYDGTMFNQNDGTDGWKTETMDYTVLIDYLGGPGYYYIGFYAESKNGGNMYIDDIDISVDSYIEGFENWTTAVPAVPPSFPPANWTVYNENGGNAWVRSTTGTHNGSGCAKCQYDSSNTPNDDWLVTKGTVVAPAGVFSLWVDGYTYSDDEFEIWMSDVGNSTTNFTVDGTLLQGVYYPDVPTTYTFYSFDMSAYEGDTVWFAVRYIGDYTWYIWADDFTFPDGTTEGFEGGTPAVLSSPVGWSQVINGADVDNKWNGVASGTNPSCSPHGGSKMARYNCYDITAGQSAFLYKNDSVDFSSYSSAILSLKFWMYHDTSYAGSNDRITVYASTIGGPELVNWTELDTFSRYDTTVGWSQHSVDISSFAGESNVWIGLLGISAYGHNMFIDDLEIDAFFPAIFDYSDNLTIDHTKVADNLVDFTVLVKTTVNPALIQSDYDDIAFSMNGTDLNFEIESYNNVTGELLAWVLFPYLSSEVDTTFQLNYGNATCGSQQNKAGTWNADYRGVYHLNETATGYTGVYNTSIIPEGDGSVNQWDTTMGSYYEAVLYEDSDYIYTATELYEHTFALTNHDLSVSGNITGVTLYARMTNGVEEAENSIKFVYLNSTTGSDESIDVPFNEESWSLLSYTFDQYRDISDVPYYRDWQWEDINNLEAGLLYSVQADADTIYCDKFWVVVSYNSTIANITYYDSTSYGYNVVTQNFEGDETDSGIIDGCINLSGENSYRPEYLKGLDGTNYLDSDAGTQSAWIYYPVGGIIAPSMVIAKHQLNHGGWNLYISSGNVNSVYFNTNEFSWQETVSDGGLMEGAWNYIVGTRGSDGGKIYINGVEASYNARYEGSLPFAEYYDDVTYLNIGDWASGDGERTDDSFYSFPGMIDEARVAFDQKSPEWVLTEYNNQNDPSGFLGEPTIITNPATNISGDSATLNGHIVPVKFDDYSSILVRPTGDGLIVNWGVVNTTYDYEAVDDIIPDNDATYVWDWEGTNEWFTVDSIPNNGGRINNVTIHAIMSSDSGNVDSVLIGLYNDSSTAETYATRTIPSIFPTFGEITRTVDANPDGNPWQWGDFNTLQIGLVGTATDTIYCTQLYIEINYQLPRNYTVWFEYGATTEYGNVTDNQTAGYDFFHDTGVLLPSTIYHYRSVLDGPYGILYGNDMEFYTTGSYPAWDINQDATVNYLDISALVSHYGDSGTPGWIPEDINSDGFVNYLDISALVSHYGESY